MNKRFILWLVAVSLLVLGCQSPPFSRFIDDMYQGRADLGQRKYSSALASFQEANRIAPSAGALAFAAIASYKMNDIPLADSYLLQAQGLNPDQIVTCIILGYQSLVRFRQGNQFGGRQELASYIAAYKNLQPESTGIRAVELAVTSDGVDVYWLELTIDEQISKLPVDYDKMGEQAGLRSGP